MRIQEFNYTIDVLQAALWQHDVAPNILQLLQNKQNFINKNHTQFWQNWYTNVFNLDTANSFGLAVWSIILQLPLFIQVGPDNDKDIWGFDDYDQNFDNGNFIGDSSGIILTPEQRRLVLKLRYFQLTTRADTPEINKFLAVLFADYGPFYALDGLDMTMTYVYLFPIDSKLLQALKEYDLLPPPATVGIKIIDGLRETWGFDQYNQNFDNGTFFDGD